MQTKVEIARERRQRAAGRLDLTGYKSREFRQVRERMGLISRENCLLDALAGLHRGSEKRLRKEASATPWQRGNALPLQSCGSRDPAREGNENHAQQELSGQDSRLTCGSQHGYPAEIEPRAVLPAGPQLCG